MNTLRAFFVLMLISLPASAQNPYQEAMRVAQAEAMDNIAFLVGEWEGEGWTDMGQGRVAFTSEEVVEARLDGLTFIVEGTHFADVPGQPEPVTVHHAVAMITYDTAQKEYVFNSQVHLGGSGVYAGHFVNGAFVWGMQAGPMQMRYTIRLDDNGRWYEIGERSQDGENWTKYFEMTLTRR